MSEKNTHDKHPKKVSTLTVIFAVIFTVLLCILIFIVIPAVNQAKKATDLFGTTTGSAAGAVGGAAQVILDIDEIRNDAVDDATDAEDTKTDFVSQLNSDGKLEVLTANVTVHNVETDGKTYAKLSVKPGTAYFAVDLSSLSKDNVKVEDNKITITLPEPEVELKFDTQNTETIAEYKNNDLIDNLLVSNDLGIKAHTASEIKTKEDAEKEILNYRFLVESAKASAESQITQLCKIVNGDSYNVQIVWKKVD